MTDWLDLDDLNPTEQIPSTLWNRLKNNQEFLRTPARYFYERDSGDANYTTTATEFENIDGTNMSVDLETFGNPVRIRLSGRIASSGAYYVIFEFTVDGVPISNNSDEGIGSARGDAVRMVNFQRLVEIEAGIHTFAAQWQVSNGTGTLYSDSAIQFEVNEEY